MIVSFQGRWNSRYRSLKHSKWTESNRVRWRKIKLQRFLLRNSWLLWWRGNSRGGNWGRSRDGSFIAAEFGTSIKNSFKLQNKITLFYNKPVLKPNLNTRFSQTHFLCQFFTHKCIWETKYNLNFLRFN